MIELKVTPYFGKISLQEIKPIDIRRGAGTSCPAAGSIRGKGVYTIVEEASGAGATKCGKLKSGAGWISLDFTKEA